MEKNLNKVFYQLHNHFDTSNFRLSDSINKLQNSIEYVANDLGQGGIAITDHEVLSNHVKAIKTVNALKDKGKIPQDFKLILGNEIYLVDKEESTCLMNNNQPLKFYHFILLAKDTTGHKILRRLSSIAWTEGYRNFRGMERVMTDYSDIQQIIEEEGKGHIIGSTACIGGFLGSCILTIKDIEEGLIEGNIDDYKAKIQDFMLWGMGVFGEDFYLEMQPALSEEQRYVNEFLLRLNKAFGVKLIITCDSHYKVKELLPVQKAFLTSQDDQGNREVEKFYNDTYFHSTEEILAKMDYIEEDTIIQAIRNTKTIGESIQEYNIFAPSKIPLIPIPPQSEWFPIPNKEEIFEKYPDIGILYNQEEFGVTEERHKGQNKYFIHQVFRGIQDRNIPTEEMDMVLERINIECMETHKTSVIKQQPMAGYLVTMQKNVEVIWEAGSFVGGGRGSVSGYITCYFLGISQINPLKYGVEMPHWRFSSAERPDIFDIDIDHCSHKKNKVFMALKNYWNSIGGDFIRVCTFKTETSKSAIKTAFRGLGLNKDIGQYLSNLVPVHRGKVASIKQCYFGDSGMNPIAEFVNIVNSYEEQGLLETLINVEGLINGRSSHACGILALNGRIEDTNAVMRTPNGELVTQFDLHDSEELSNLKYDFLITDCQTLLQTTFEALIEKGKIEWQGSLRATYNKYLHFDSINKTDKKLFDRLNRNDFLCAFQFDSPMGMEAIRKLPPETLIDIANDNSIMRLSVDEGEQPIDKAKRYKEDITEWYRDMKKYELNQEEIKVLEKHLLQDRGICSSQERLMLMSMDNRISNFTQKDANNLRKTIGKKLVSKIPEMKQMFYDKGYEVGTRKQLLDYVWEEQFSMQLGYAFSILHTMAYSMILMQSLNLAVYYPDIYWNTAVLLSQSGCLEMEDSGDEELDEHKKDKTTKYGKTATAISNLRKNGVMIEPPNINEADLYFIPKEDTNSILFGLQGVTSMNRDTVGFILENRPYKSMRDFYDKLVLGKREVINSKGNTTNKSYVSKKQMAMLIKAGAFDTIEDKPRNELLIDFIKWTHPKKHKLTTNSIQSLIDIGIIPTDLQDCLRFYHYRNFVKSCPYMKDLDEEGKEKSKITWHNLRQEDQEYQDYVEDFFNEFFAGDMTEGIDYRYEEDGSLTIAMVTKRKGSFEWKYNQLIKDLSEWLLLEDSVKVYNDIMLEQYKDEYDYYKGISNWEMESMSYYYHGHELENVDKDLYSIVSFEELGEEPTVVGYTKYKDTQYPKYKLSRILGTVLDKNTTKHMVTLLTPTGVVTLKFQQGQFAFYNKDISRLDEVTGKKQVIEEGWFKRGSLLMVTGYRTGNQFKPKKYKDSVYQHTIQKITAIDGKGILTLESERTHLD